MAADLRAPLHPVIFATDASTKGGGICSARAPLKVQLALYDLAEGGGEHVRMSAEAEAARARLMTPVELGRLSAAAALSVPLQWASLVAIRFKEGAHINVLELLMVWMMLKRLARSGATRQRVLVLVDSGVVKGAGTKGRSSARALNFYLS